MFSFQSSFVFIRSSSHRWYIHMNVCSPTWAPLCILYLVYFVFVVYGWGGKRTHGAHHILMEKPLENKQPCYCQSLAKGTIYFSRDTSADSCSQNECCKVSRFLPFSSQRISSSFLTMHQMNVCLLLPISRSQHEKL